MLKPMISILAVALLMAGSFSVSTHAAADMFLKIEGIQGESKDKVHADEIDVFAWSWGTTNSGSLHAGGTGTLGKPRFADLSLTKYVDRSTPNLVQKLATGEHYPEASLVVRSTGADPVEYIKITLKDVLVSSLSIGGTGGEDRLKEDITLNFAQIKLTYTPFTTGNTQAERYFLWNLPKGAGTSGIVGEPEPVAGLASTVTYASGNPVARLTWVSTAGATYQVWATSDLGTSFQRYGNPIPSAGDGSTVLTLPADTVRQFFLIETIMAP